MEEQHYYEYGKENNTKCKHDIAWIKHCSECVFQVLCRLEEKSYNEKP